MDGLWSAAALVHVPVAETVPTLRAWHAALRPGGLLGLSAATGDGEGWEPVAGDGHLRWFAHREPQALLAALAEAGFEVREHAENAVSRSWCNVLAARPAPVP
ncbi:class I SAM-dependent methyltransferase [Nonomuraea sp. N2-4H]|uniref:hypothetical protein n=1 Tax=Nonomuraea sp. N2-4H TaxID=3128898 RepID=UPI00324EEF1F